MDYLRIKVGFTPAKEQHDEMLITGSSNNSVASENEPDTTANPPKEIEMEAFYQFQSTMKPTMFFQPLHKNFHYLLKLYLTSNTRGMNYCWNVT